MNEQSGTNKEIITVGKGKISHLAVASLAIAAAAIPFMFISVQRIKTLQSSQTCLIKETPFYRTVDTAGSILPAVSVIFGILSLIRYWRHRSPFLAEIPALAGIILAVTSYTVYFLALLALAEMWPR